MEGRDVAQLITAIVVPLIAVVLVHQLGRRLTLQRAAMDTFHRLVKNVNDFRLALIANQSHALHSEKYFQTYDAMDKLIDSAKTPTSMDEIKLYGEIRDKWIDNIWDEERRGVDALRALREATASVKADMLMVKMIFGEKAKNVMEHLCDLLELGDVFDTMKTKGVPPKFEECRHLPFEENIAKIDADVETLWERSVRRDLDDLR